MYTQSQLQGGQTATQTLIQDLNLAEIIDDLFLVLTTKEKDVIIKRFSLTNQPRQTLEKIGRQFNVTRERIRQIEKIALNKLRRTIDNSRLKNINDTAKQILHENGGLMRESIILNEISKNLNESSPVDKHIILLAMHIDPEIKKSDKSNETYEYWYLKEDPTEKMHKIFEVCKMLLEKNKDVIATEELIKEIAISKEKGNIQADEKFVASCLKTDKQLKFTSDAVGLSSWRHINPKSIRDKAFIVLKKAQKPLHFIEIANKISEVGFDKKVVTNQAVHNELIRCDQFVLVGRGLYALKEWGYKSGTVSDIIEMLLKKKSPLTKKQIIKGVLKQRKVKKGTISLNLQKNPNFLRVGRAVYALKK